MRLAIKMTHSQVLCDGAVLFFKYILWIVHICFTRAIKQKGESKHLQVLHTFNLIL